METSWRLWCRLCARKPSSESDEQFQNISDSASYLAEIIHRCFPISGPLNITPIPICPECVDFLAKIKSFEEICLKSEKLFKEIVEMEKKEVEEENIGTPDVYLSEDSEEVPLGRVTRKKLATKRKPKPNKKTKRIYTKKRKFTDEDSIADNLNLEEAIKTEIKTENVVQDLKSSQNKSKKLRSANDAEESAEFNKETIVQKKLRKKKDDTVWIEQKGQNLIRCSECPNTFKNKKQMKLHFNETHRPNYRTIRHECDQCFMTFLCESSLRIHEKTHIPLDQRTPLVCPQCDKQFFSSSGLDMHILSAHKNEKSYVCEECGKAFVSAGGLKKHKISHTDDRPFQCQKCPKRFKGALALKTHTDSHAGTEYICPICGKRLNTKNILNKHMVVHSDVKKYKCQYCGNEFKRAKSLKGHLMMHSGLHPYSCPFCGKTFNSSSNCRTHKLKVHTEEFAALEAGQEGPHRVTLPKLHQLQPKFGCNSDPVNN